MWEMFKEFIFNIISWLHSFCGDWGLAIILVTIVFRAIMLPIMHKQTKSSFAMKKLNPEMERIKELYADDKQRQSEELQKVYAEAKFNPISGCLPMIIQMPIFIALFQVLRELGDRVEGSDYCFYNIVPNLIISPSDAWQQGFVTAIPYLVLIAIFAGATFLPMILQQQGQADKQKRQMIIMSVVMSVMMLFIGWGSPAGVLLFWGTSSLLALAQQQTSMRILKSKEKQAEDEKQYQPVKVNVVRQERKKRPKKKK
ncbi:MAG: YidC/Oxa1 family membrane protein insertase [Coriobacteriia bacterium]|nr:YidC/Oxa1 family membrane protein insertase [Coriobacteriia bacterium]